MFIIEDFFYESLGAHFQPYLFADGSALIALTWSLCNRKHGEAEAY